MSEEDTLAKALYDQQVRRNIEDGTAVYYAVPWEGLPEGSRDYWRREAAELSDLLKKK